MSTGGQRRGKVYLVGAGPGAPGLLSLRGRDCLLAADVVIYDYLVNPAILEHARPNCERICLGRHGGGRLLSQAEVQQLLLDHAERGQQVVRLKSGDPVIFGHLVEELAALDGAGIAYEIVPGITAALAAGSVAGIPLTHRELASAVALVTGQESAGKAAESLDFGRLASFPGTLLIYMGVTTAPDWSAKLIAAGKDPATPVAIVRRCSWADQTVVHCTLAEVAAEIAQRRLRPPVVSVVGPVAAPQLAFDWRAALPLSGKKMLVARAAGQSAELVDQLERLGAEAVVQPAIEISPPAWEPVDRAIAALHQFDWIVFSSANGVDHFCGRIWTLGRDGRALAASRIAAIGPGTAHRLEQWRLRADLVPEAFRAEDLADALAPEASGRRFLLLRASRGREVLAERLASAGGIVEQVVVYRSTDIEAPRPEISERLARGELDWVLITSSAIARSLARMFGDRLRRCKLASISPVTSATLRELGYETNLEASEYSLPGLVAELCQYYSQQ